MSHYFAGRYPLPHERLHSFKRDIATDDEVLVEGSDTEDSPRKKFARWSKREAIGRAYIEQGNLPFIQSARLRGPFDRKNEWTNPWSHIEFLSLPSSNSTQLTSPSGPQLEVEPVEVQEDVAEEEAGNSGLPINGANPTSDLDVLPQGEIPTDQSRHEDAQNMREAERSTGDQDMPEAEDLLHKVQEEIHTLSSSLSEDTRIHGANQGKKRGADLHWLKGLNLIKRSRYEFSTPSSPTPKSPIQRAPRARPDDAPLTELDDRSARQNHSIEAEPEENISLDAAITLSSRSAKLCSTADIADISTTEQVTTNVDNNGTKGKRKARKSKVPSLNTDSIPKTTSGLPATWNVSKHTPVTQKKTRGKKDNSKKMKPCSDWTSCRTVEIDTLDGDELSGLSQASLLSSVALRSSKPQLESHSSGDSRIHLGRDEHTLDAKVFNSQYQTVSPCPGSFLYRKTKSRIGQRLMKGSPANATPNSIKEEEAGQGKRSFNSFSNFDSGMSFSRSPLDWHHKYMRPVSSNMGENSGKISTPTEQPVLPIISSAYSDRGLKGSDNADPLAAPFCRTGDSSLACQVESAFKSPACPASLLGISQQGACVPPDSGAQPRSLDGNASDSLIGSIGSPWMSEAFQKVRTTYMALNVSPEQHDVHVSEASPATSEENSQVNMMVIDALNAEAGENDFNLLRSVDRKYQSEVSLNYSAQSPWTAEGPGIHDVATSGSTGPDAQLPEEGMGLWGETAQSQPNRQVSDSNSTPNAAYDQAVTEHISRTGSSRTGRTGDDSVGKSPVERFSTPQQADSISKDSESESSAVEKFMTPDGANSVSEPLSNEGNEMAMVIDDTRNGDDLPTPKVINAPSPVQQKVVLPNDFPSTQILIEAATINPWLTSTKKPSPQKPLHRVSFGDKGSAPETKDEKTNAITTISPVVMKSEFASAKENNFMSLSPVRPVVKFSHRQLASPLLKSPGVVAMAEAFINAEGQCASENWDSSASTSDSDSDSELLEAKADAEAATAHAVEQHKSDSVLSKVHDSGPSFSISSNGEVMAVDEHVMKLDEEVTDKADLGATIKEMGSFLEGWDVDIELEKANREMLRRGQLEEGRRAASGLFRVRDY